MFHTAKNAMSTTKQLFNEIVDYAGLFPPASQSLDQVVANYAQYLESNDAWMLARLIVPAGRLFELQQHQPFLDSKRLWKISSLVPGVDTADNGFSQALTTIDEFNDKYSSKAIVDTVEIKAPNERLVESTIEQMPKSLIAFLELPHHDDPNALVELVANGPENILAKVRTGGVTPELIPSPAEVARFIYRCGQNNAGFKATAGLHHPLRGDYRLTYDSNAPQGTMFGFVNVFVAACFAFSEFNEQELIEQILVCNEAAKFNFGENAITFGELKVDSDSIAATRAGKAISFGSCSFTEPTTELKELGWASGG